MKYELIEFIATAYGTFVSMQTGMPMSPQLVSATMSLILRVAGNTIFLGLGASTSHENDSYGWAKSGTSIFCFTLGAGFFARFCRFVGTGKRKTFVLSFLLQCVLIWAMAGVVQGRAVVGDLSAAMKAINWREELPIALLSFQAAGQIVCSRNLAMAEIPTVVLTSVMCDFASDPKILDGLGKNAKRNRRFLGFTALLIGAIAGGWIGKATGGVQYVLWVAGGVKFSLVCAWALWPKKEDTCLS